MRQSVELRLYIVHNAVRLTPSVSENAYRFLILR
jgi:hypothetical protein